MDSDFRCFCALCRVSPEVRLPLRELSSDVGPSLYQSLGGLAPKKTSSESNDPNELSPKRGLVTFTPKCVTAGMPAVYASTCARVSKIWPSGLAYQQDGGNPGAYRMRGTRFQPGGSRSRGGSCSTDCDGEAEGEGEEEEKEEEGGEFGFAVVVIFLKISSLKNEKSGGK